MVEPPDTRSDPTPTNEAAGSRRWGGVQLHDSSIELPVRRNSAKRVQVQFEDLKRIGITRDAESLVLSTSNESYTLDANQMGGPAELGAFRTALLERISAHPDGIRIQRTLQRLMDLERHFVARKPNWTNAFIVICSIAFLGQLLWRATLPASGVSGDEQIRISRLLAMGANAPALIDRGEYFRLAIANFLHGGPVHFGLNIAGLWVVGPLVERVWGPARFLVLFLASALGGAAASTWITVPPLSLGVSTALVGLVGAYFVLWIRYRDILPPSFLVSTQSWVLLVVVNGTLWAIVPGIDHWGHAGGGLTGALLVLLVHPGRAPPDFIRPAGPPMRLVGWGLAVVFVAAGAWALVSATNRPVDEGLALVLEREADRSFVAANEYAWAVVTSPGSSRRLLEAARGAAESAIARSPDDTFRAAVLDTTATAYYRLGDFAKAIDLSLSSVRIDPQSQTISQLTRFLRAYLRSGSPWTDGTAYPSGIAITKNESQLTLTYPGASSDVTIGAIVRRGDYLEGSVWLRLEAGTQTPKTWPLSGSLQEALRHPETEIQVALLATERVTLKKSDGSLKYFPLESEIRSLP